MRRSEVGRLSFGPVAGRLGRGSRRARWMPGSACAGGARIIGRADRKRSRRRGAQPI